MKPEYKLRRFVRHASDPFRKEQPFTYEQFLSDCESAFPRYAKALAGNGINIRVFIRDGDEGIANVQGFLEDHQYIINFYREGFFRPCFDLLVGPATTYYRRHEPALDVNLDLFLRMTLTVAALMAFWHEVAHIVRGLFSYEKAVGQVLDVDWTDDPQSVLAWLDTSKYPVLPRRLLEIDADIFGAQFTLAHVVVSAKSDGKIKPTTFWQCFGIGVRGLFEVLCQDGPHDASTGRVHPHALSRAYAAISHSLVRLDAMDVSKSDAAAAIALGHHALLDFELHDCGHHVDPLQLAAFAQSELELWRQRSDELLPFQLIRSQAKRK